MGNDLLAFAKEANEVWGKAVIQTSKGPLETAEVMLCICLQESGANRRAQGDSLLELAAYPPTQALVHACNCKGFGSHGGYQCFMPMWKSYLQQETDLAQPCDWADYLYTIPFATKVAAHILQEQGLTAWSTYGPEGLGPWYNQLTTAQTALKTVRGG